MSGESTAFEAKEIESLKALRRAAAEIHRSSVMRGEQVVRVSLSIRVGSPLLVESEGHDEERFRSFVVALRKTYAQSDGANFLRSLNILSRHREDLRDELKSLRAAYLDTLRNGQIDLNGLSYEEIFEAWLYGSVFHDDDAELRARWERLSGDGILGAVAQVILQEVTIRLAECVLVLDALVADALGEDRLPDLPGYTGVAPAPRVPAYVVVRPRRHRQRGTYWLDILNSGATDVHRVQMDAMDPLDGAGDVLVHGERERKLPRELLRPGEQVSLMVALAMGEASEFDVAVSWDDPSGERRAERYRIDFLAA